MTIPYRKRTQSVSWLFTVIQYLLYFFSREICSICLTLSVWTLKTDADDDNDKDDNDYDGGDDDDD